MKKRWGIAAVTVVILAGICMVLLSNKSSINNTQTEIQKLLSLTGVTRIIEKEEYDFYSEIVRKDGESIKGDTNEEVLSYIQDVYAQFSIGAELGLCNPYSFSALKRDMEHENQVRKLKLEKQQVFYGPEEFQLEGYFRYVLNNLKLDIVEKLADTADRELENEAEQYFAENEEIFSALESVAYRITSNGVTEDKILRKEDMSTLEKTNSDLFQNLCQGAEGDKFHYKEDGLDAQAEILRKETAKVNFEERREEVLKRYITEMVYPKLIKQIGSQNPVEIAE